MDDDVSNDEQELPLLLEGPFIEAFTTRDEAITAELIAPPSGGALH